jgi:osmotically-inducible protein OsmY
MEGAMYRPDDRQQNRQREMSGSEQSGSMEQENWQGQSRGNWSGYVVPYRYYGPGYRGVGYYSVLYQGPGAGEEPTAEGDEQQFDQRDVDYGQGQGAGAAWTRGGGGQRSRMSGYGYGRSAGGYGGFAGRGPKGYQRSDQRLEEEINDRLMADDWVDASDLQVKVKDGEVTLTGTVRDRQAKRRAEDIAEQVMGVRDVMNQVRVESESGSGRQGSTGSRSGSASTSSRASTTRGSSRNGGRSSDASTETASSDSSRSAR